MNKIQEMIAEINQNYDNLGEDLLMLEAVVLVSTEETGFPEEYVVSSKERLGEYICQHTEEIEQLTGYLIRLLHQNAPRHRAY